MIGNRLACKARHCPAQLVLRRPRAFSTPLGGLLRAPCLSYSTFSHGASFYFLCTSPYWDWKLWSPARKHYRLGCLTINDKSPYETQSSELCIDKRATFRRIQAVQYSVPLFQAIWAILKLSASFLGQVEFICCGTDGIWYSCTIQKRSCIVNSRSKHLESSYSR